MNDRAAFAGSYADFKVVKTRSVVSVSIEIPIEQADDFVKMFGLPQPGKERPVALALLKSAGPGSSAPSALPTGQQRSEAGKDRRPFHERSRKEQAGILCKDTRFQLWLSSRGIAGENAADAVRNYCGVASRALLDEPEYWAARRDFDVLVAAYFEDTGQMAEQRA